MKEFNGWGNPYENQGYGYTSSNMLGPNMASYGLQGAGTGALSGSMAGAAGTGSAWEAALPSMIADKGMLATSYGTGMGAGMAEGAGAGAVEGAAGGSVMGGLAAGLGWGLLAGLVKNILIDEPKRKKQVALQATTAQLSPWTGLKPDMSKTESRLGENLMQFGMTGAALGQGVQQLQGQQELAQAQKELIKAQSAALNPASRTQFRS